MQITLTQQHIEAAIHDYMAKAAMKFEVESIDFTAGRGKTGLTATVEMEDPFSPMFSTAGAKPKKQSTPPASKETLEEPSQEEEMPQEEETVGSDFYPEEEVPVEAPKKEKASLFS